MKILTNPNVPYGHIGTFTPIPDALRHLLSPWAEVSYQRCDFGSILTQHFICRHYSIYIYYFFIEKKRVLYAICDEPTTALQFTMEGKIPGNIKADTDVSLEADTCSLVYLPKGGHEVFFDPGTISSLHIEFAPGYIATLTDEWPGQEELMNMINAAYNKGVLFPRVNFNYKIKEVLHKLRYCCKEGIELRLEFQILITTLLGLYMEAIRQTVYIDQLPSITHKEVLVKIWQDIKDQPNIKDFQLDRLAGIYYMDRKTLARNFKDLFGISLHSFLFEQCMLKSRDLLTGSQKSIVDISYLVGYADADSFKRAFKKYYGKLPQEYRSK